MIVFRGCGHIQGGCVTSSRMSGSVPDDRVWLVFTSYVSIFISSWLNAWICRNSGNHNCKQEHYSDA